MPSDRTLRVPVWTLLVTILVPGPALGQWGVAVEEGKYSASDAHPGAGFGGSVAVHGDTALVGSLDEAAYVFLRDGASLAEEARLSGSGILPGDGFGQAVCLSPDLAFVGAPGADHGQLDGGAVFVFSRTAGVWSEVAVLTAGDAATGDEFGCSLAQDGDVLVIGAKGSLMGRGAAYVFEDLGGVWTEQAKLVASDGTAGDGFGSSVAVRGVTIALGAPHDDQDGADAGSAYLFEDTGAGWAEVGRLAPDAPQAGARFGADLDLGFAFDGIPGFYPQLLVGIPGWDGEGAAMLFERYSMDIHQEQVIRSLTSGPGDEFGASISISPLESKLVIGAPGDGFGGGSERGSVHLYVQTDTNYFDYLTTLTASDSQSGDRFGGGAAIWSDFLVTGAKGADDGGLDAGAIYHHRVVVLPFFSTYCYSLPNSTGTAALASVLIEPGQGLEQFTLLAAFVPDEFGIFFFGNVPVDVPFGNGVRCVGGAGVVRFPPAVAQNGFLEYEVDVAMPPLAGNVTPGRVSYFQAWFRDPGAGGASFNLSSGFGLWF